MKSGVWNTTFVAGAAGRVFGIHSAGLQEREKTIKQQRQRNRKKKENRREKRARKGEKVEDKKKKVNRKPHTGR